MSEAKVIISEIEKNVPILGNDSFVIGTGIKAKKGRSFRPIVKSSYEAFTREYGKADPTFSKDHYCVEDAFVESTSLMVCRVHNGGTLASASIPKVGGTSTDTTTIAGLAEDEGGITAPDFTGEDFAFVVASLGAGTYGNSVSIKILDGDGVNTFIIEVYDTSVSSTVAVESFEVSRKLMLNASGTQMFLEERINDISEYIIVFNNSAEADTVLPAATAGLVALTGGLDDGGAVSATGDLDSKILITAVEGIAGNITVTLIDGGTAGSEGVSLSNGVLTITIEDGVSTQAQIATAIASHVLISTAVADTDGDAWTLGVGTDSVVLTGGVDAGINDVDYMKALPILFGAKELGLPKVKLYMDNGIATSDYAEAIITACEENRSFAILSIPEATERSTDIANLVTYRTSITTAGKTGSYGALYTSWQKRKDTANNIDVMVPFVGKVASVFTKADASNAVPSGSGVGNFTSSAPNRKFTSTERSVLYDADVNAYKRYPTEGYLVWGQKTLHGDNNSAFSRINTRLVFNDIEDDLEDAISKFTFKYVNQDNLDEFADSARARLRSYVDNGRVYAFKVVAEIGVNNTAQTIANREFIVDVYVQESISAELMKINMIRTSFDTTFNEG